jgi:hypothetical protein
MEVLTSIVTSFIKNDRISGLVGLPAILNGSKFLLLYHVRWKLFNLPALYFIVSSHVLLNDKFAIWNIKSE